MDRYSVLFRPYLDSGQIEFCYWNDENTTTFAAALNNLADKVRGEKVWRAIVALPIVDTDERDWTNECKPDNPFDFLCNSDPEPGIKESSVPLIRLAQMLGGVPLVTPSYRSSYQKVDDEVYGSHYELVSKPEQPDEQLATQQREWQKLQDKYSTSCVLPSSLYLFSGRLVPEIVIPKTTDAEILQRHENDSSMFWYRNRYPAKARFLTQEFCRPGNAHFNENLFNYWMTVLTLAINEYPSGTFEAYKLYNVDAHVSAESFRSVINAYYSRLDTLRYTAHLQVQELKKDMQHTRTKDELPKYEVTIPVTYPHLDDSDLLISHKGIGLANDCPRSESSWWYEAAKRSRKALDKLLSAIRPALDRASSNCRFLARVTEEELVEMDEYQVMELEEQLSELEGEILSFTRASALPIGSFRNRMEMRKKATATRIRKRMSRKIAVISGIIGLLLYVGGFIPDIVRQALNYGLPTEVLLLVLAGVIGMILTAMGCLLVYRGGLIQHINDYNGTMNNILEEIRYSESRFSEYLTKCCTYMRGRSMLQMLTQKTMMSVSEIKQMTNHMERLKDYMSVASAWLSDFGFVPHPDESYGRVVEFDFEIPPERNSGYLLQTDEIKPLIPSLDGDSCLAPYPFVSRFTVVRVPVFEEWQEEATETFDEEETVHGEYFMKREMKAGGPLAVGATAAGEKARQQGEEENK